MRNVVAFFALLLGALAGVGTTHAQDGPIRILVGLPPGGAVDIGARLLGAKLQASLGQAVIIENKPGASARLAVHSLIAAPPNGQTLLVTPDSVLTLFPHVFKDVGYNSLKDLTPISQIYFSSYGFAVPAESPAKNFAEFVALAKSDPKYAQFASPSSGSAQHVFGLQLGVLIGKPLDHIPFKGAADAINAILSNSVPSTILSLGELTSMHDSKKLRILASFSTERTKELPDVPTFIELGYPEMQGIGAVSIYGPAGMKPELVEHMSGAVRDALKDPLIVARLTAMSVTVAGSTSNELAAHNKSEFDRWAAAVKATSFVPN